MSEHRTHLEWFRTSEEFTYETYNRDFEWRNEHGIPVPSSAAVDYKGNADRINPEESLIAALSGCHMLSFLAIAAKKRLALESYTDAAVGTLEKNADGKLSITKVVLHPKVVWAPDMSVSQDDLLHLHHLAHEACFIANSVKTDVRVEPQG